MTRLPPPPGYATNWIYHYDLEKNNTPLQQHLDDLIQTLSYYYYKTDDFPCQTLRNAMHRNVLVLCLTVTKRTPARAL